MRKFILQSTRFEGQIVFLYNLSGWMIEYRCEAELSQVQHEWLFRNMPFRLESLEAIAKASAGITVTELLDDVTFEEFWTLYNYKEGSKIKAEAIWKKLQLADKIGAIRYIKPYDKYLKDKGTAKALGSTYLTGKYWIK